MVKTAYTGHSFRYGPSYRSPNAANTDYFALPLFLYYLYAYLPMGVPPSRSVLLAVENLSLEAKYSPKACTYLRYMNVVG